MIRNPVSNKEPVDYVLDDRHAFTLKPGFIQRLEVGYAWKIRFDRGGEHGQIDEILRPGSYEFSKEGDRWTLRRRDEVKDSKD